MPVPAPARPGAADVSPPGGHAAGQRAEQDAEQFVVPGRAADDHTCRRPPPGCAARAARLAAKTASFRRSRIARHSAGLCRRSTAASRRPGGASRPAVAGRQGRPGTRGSVLGLEPRFPSSRTHGPRFTQSAAARGIPRVSATATVRVPRRRRDHLTVRRDDVDGARAHVDDDGAGTGARVVQAPNRAAAGSLSTHRTGQPSRPARTAAWSRPGLSRCSDETPRPGPRRPAGR